MSGLRVRVHTDEQGVQTWRVWAPVDSIARIRVKDKPWLLIPLAGPDVPFRLSDAETTGDGWSEAAVTVLPEATRQIEVEGIDGRDAHCDQWEAAEGSVTAWTEGVEFGVVGLVDRARTEEYAAALLAASRRSAEYAAADAITGGGAR